ncbi:MAG TPA: tRNA pseudouridine(38-40) synthase TruA [Ruminococcaceae bacterium]|nr:tRNA pseudouridine(38-40) synthase TruA [Oscillospiraceae bacterium]
MQRLLLTLRFDGTRYHGWQVQNNAVTVQQILQDAIERVTGFRSPVIGCSRTDAGVHANMFCCTIDTASALRGKAMTAALNANLPRDIAVYRCREVTQDFHPRYSASGKRYLYRIWNASERNPFWENYAIHQRRVIDTDRLNMAAADYIGKHDFASFCAAGSSVQDTVRSVKSCGISREGELVTFYVEADGFLYNMVRIMVGTLLDISAGKREYDCIPSVIQAHNRLAAGATAPAKGLILNRVYYDGPFADIEI